MVYDPANQNVICTGQSNLALKFGLSDLRVE
jgi:hypothetical protein